LLYVADPVVGVSEFVLSDQGVPVVRREHEVALSAVVRNLQPGAGFKRAPRSLRLA
jgi:hypothetical protein